MTGKTRLFEGGEEELTDGVEDIETQLEEVDEDSGLDEANEILEPEENFFSRCLPTSQIAKGGYFAAKPEDWLLKGENEPTDDAFVRNSGLEIGGGAVIGAVGAHAFDPTGLYTQALSDPDPVNIAMAGTAGLVGNSILGAFYGGTAGGMQNVARGMAGATLAASGATHSFMTNNVLRGLERAEKYLRDNEESELADAAVRTFDKLTAEAEAFYDRISGKDETETYSPRDLDELENRFSEMEKYGEIRELETSFQTLTDRSEFSEIIEHLQNDNEIEIRDEDIQIKERQEGRLATYRGQVDFHYNIDGEPYRSDEYALEFEAAVSRPDTHKINI